jgi:hypothetical protein
VEGLGQLKNPVTSSEIEPATFRLVAYGVSHYATACPEGGGGTRRSKKEEAIKIKTVDLKYNISGNLIFICYWVDVYGFQRCRRDGLTDVTEDNWQ